MSHASTAETLHPETAPPRTRIRKPRESSSKAAEHLEVMRETLRQEVREEEFGALLDCLEETSKTIQVQSEMLVKQNQAIAKAVEIIEQQGTALTEVRDVFHSFHANGLTIQMPEGAMTINLAAGTGTVNDAVDKVDRDLSGDEYVVRSVFMDFIEAYSALGKGFRDRRPLLANQVQARYSDSAEPQLMIMRRGEFGTNENMRDTILTLCIHDNDPFIDGEYMEFGKTVRMSDTQVLRCMNAIITALRKETNPEGD